MTLLLFMALSPEAIKGQSLEVLPSSSLCSHDDDKRHGFNLLRPKNTKTLPK